MLINICFLLTKGLLLTDEKGDLKMSKYLDERQMHNLYEKFILEYYSIMLHYNQMFNSNTLHSNNMYQIFTYVKNKDIKHDGSVSGVLLYAKTKEEEMLDQN